jgi:hypothetical protein
MSRKLSVLIVMGASLFAFGGIASGDGQVTSTDATTTLTSSTFCPLAGSPSYTVATLEACGMDAWPQTSEQALPGGGQETTYDEGSFGTVTVLVPPASFDPLTASSAQLSEYGFPEPPNAGTDEYAEWELAMSVWSGSPAAPALDVSNPASTDDTESSIDWGGWGVTESNGYFTEAAGQYTEPSQDTSRCSSDSSAFWSGIGGWSGHDLAQTGTGYGQGIDGGHPYAGFWEIVPSASDQGDGSHYIGLTPNPGYGVFVEVTRISNGYQFFMEDLTNGNSRTVTATGGDYNSYSGYSAETMAEYPSPPALADKSSSGLTNFDVFTVDDSWGDGNPLNSYPDTSGPSQAGQHRLNTYGNVTSNELMNATGFANDTGGFSVSQDDCN